MLQNLRNPYSRRTIHVVVDNHRAHHCVSRQLAQDSRIKFVFQPAYSPEFNCQEGVWRSVKSSYRKRILRRDSDIEDYAHHKNFVLDVLRDVTPMLNVNSLLGANDKLVAKLLS